MPSTIVIAADNGSASRTSSATISAGIADGVLSIRVFDQAGQYQTHVDVDGEVFMHLPALPAFSEAFDAALTALRALLDEGAAIA